MVKATPDADRALVVPHHPGPGRRPPQAGPPQPLTVVERSRASPDATAERAPPPTIQAAAAPRSAAGPLREGLQDASETATRPALALKEGIDTPNRFEDPKRGGCRRVPDWFKLVDVNSGECIDPRCKATNKCEHCRKIAAAETVEMLLLDALSGDAPTLMLTLTARSFPRGDELRRTLGKIVKACRLRWPDFEWFVPRERQTRGQLHIHPLVKHVPMEDKRALYELVTRIWCARHDAIAYPYEIRHRGPQGVKSVTEGQGLVRYLTKELAHSLKSAQALELGFRGHRTSQTRGYFPEGAQVARAAARRSLHERRLAYRLNERGGDPLELAQLLDQEQDREWVLMIVGAPPTQSRRLALEAARSAAHPPPRPG